jgi:hypothetical protein
MGELTAEQLREFPLKDRWSPEESLALYETTEGFENINGLATPQYVQRRDDRVRWANCVRVASQSTGEPASGQLAAATARTMYAAREIYTE